MDKNWVKKWLISFTIVCSIFMFINGTDVKAYDATFTPAKRTQIEGATSKLPINVPTGQSKVVKLIMPEDGLFYYADKSVIGSLYYKENLTNYRYLSSNYLKKGTYYLQFSDYEQAINGYLEAYYYPVNRDINKPLPINQKIAVNSRLHLRK